VKKRLKRHIRSIQGTAEGRGPFDRLLISVYNFYLGIKRKLRDAEGPYSSRLYLKTKQLKRNLQGSRINFVSIDQASIWTMEWIQTFPRRYDLIVGVPRSGMLIASLVALKLGKGLTTPELLQNGGYWHSSVVQDELPLDGRNHILLVDDAMHSGNSMTKALDMIRSRFPDVQISKACLIVRDEAKSKVDLFHKVIAPPRAYEWNILHRKIASQLGNGILAVDLDGVLCANCPREVDDDEELYLQWIANARPYLIPAFEIDAIVTSRLEKYRRHTEVWLKKHNVKYKELCMWDIPSKSQRHGQFAQHKIEHLIRIKPDIFWESAWTQSQKIWRETRIPTLCIDDMTLLS